MLSAAQLEEYKKNSCLFLPGFFPQKVAENLQTWSLELPLLDGVQVTFEKGAITRCENFVGRHDLFGAVANNSSNLARACAELFGEPESCLVKEKLNFKPAGGAGFMPHLDHPSLAFYLPKHCDSFITAMVAIDEMTAANGCLRVARGVWSAENAVECIPPDGDPEVGGRAGAIAEAALKGLVFDDVPCQPGDVLLFNGWVEKKRTKTSAQF
jgi:hypothetical protein